MTRLTAKQALYRWRVSPDAHVYRERRACVIVGAEGFDDKWRMHWLERDGRKAHGWRLAHGVFAPGDYFGEIDD